MRQMAFVSPFSSPFVKPFPSEGAAATQLFYDTFTDADGTNLNLHTPNVDTVGGGWVAYSAASDIQIQSNKAKNVTTSGERIYAVNVNDANVTVNCKIAENIGDNSATGLCIRLTDVNNHWLIAITRSANTFRILEKNGGSYTTRATTSFTPSDGVEYNISVVTSGNSITATINGGSSINYSSSFNATATRHGLALRDTLSTADNFEILAT